MADDTTTDDTTQDTTADETSTSTDDLAGLKSALSSEREQRKAAEKQARTNAKAAEELEKLRTESMTAQEKAVAEAEQRGKTTAAVDYGKRLAAAEFKAAVAAKGLDLGEALDLIDTTRFVDEQGDVDEAEIKKAVTKLAKIAASRGPGQSGGDFGGGNGNGAPPKNLHEQIADAEAKGDWKAARQLKTQLMFTTQ
ncbi:hypothetical protein ACFXJ8_11920 [Nonomuraea sp. NPDC059194]|uniref:hypothetical protein n=1 Tax=Nonomuraea sp. NPDC059194 TaxID=3346764 RepID=UPI0036932EE0